MSTTSGCSVSATDVSGAQSEVNRLTSETTSYQSSVNELTNEITQLQTNTDPSAMNNIYAAYISLLNQYNTASFQTQIINGAGRQAADNEVTAKQQALNDASSRLGACGNPNSNYYVPPQQDVGH